MGGGEGGGQADGAASGSRLREGFVATPRDWIERVRRGELTPEQLGVLVCTADEANRDAKAVRLYDGRELVLGRGEALTGARKFAERHNMGAGGRERAVRAWRRAEALGICAMRPAADAPPPAPGAAPRSAPPPAPPPTIVSFNRDSEILWPRERGTPPPAPPPAPGGAPPPAPIQPVTPAPENLDSQPSRTRARSRPAGAVELPEEVEELRAALEAHEGRSLAVAAKENRAEVIARLMDNIGRLGRDDARQAAIETANELRRKGDPIVSLAALPGWLDTVQPSSSKREAAA